MKKFIAILLVCLMAITMIPMMSSAAEKTLENIALGKTAVDGNGNEAAGITDGVADNCVVDIVWNFGTNEAPGEKNPNCFVEVDLGAETVIKGIGVANYKQGTSYYWEAYGSNDNTVAIDQWTKLCEKKDDRISNAAVYKFDVTETTAYRYVRIVGVYHSGNIGYHFNEVQVYAETANSVELGTVLGEGYLNDGAAYWQVVVADQFGGATFNLFSDAEVAPTLADYANPEETPWYQFKDQIAFANIYGVANVPKVALKGYPNLNTVQVGEGVTTIGGDAFANNTGITLYIPLSVTTFAQGTTYGTTVTNCYFPGTLDEWQARWGTEQVWYLENAPQVNSVDGVDYTMYNYQNGYWGAGVVGETEPDFTGCPTTLPNNGGDNGEGGEGGDIGGDEDNQTGESTVIIAALAVVALFGTAVIVKKVND